MTFYEVQRSHLPDPNVKYSNELNCDAILYYYVFALPIAKAFRMRLTRIILAEWIL